MPDTKLTSTVKSKDKSSKLKQRFGHVNATNPNSYLNIIFIELLHDRWIKTTTKVKFELLSAKAIYFFVKRLKT